MEYVYKVSIRFVSNVKAGIGMLEGKLVPGYTLKDSDEIYGDEMNKKEPSNHKQAVRVTRNNEDVASSDS